MLQSKSTYVGKYFGTYIVNIRVKPMMIMSVQGSVHGQKEESWHWGDRPSRIPHPPDFGRYANPILTKGVDYSHQITASPSSTPLDFQPFLRP